VQAVEKVRTKKTLLRASNPCSQRVMRIGSSIVAAARSGGGGGDWQHVLWRRFRFYAIDNPQTFYGATLPDGTVVVSTGLLNSLDDGQLAAVLAHEVGHTLARHSAEKEVVRLRELPNVLLAKLVKSQAPTSRVKAVGAALQRASLLRRLQHSQTCEYEADLIGMHLLAEACYDPREMGKLMGTMRIVTGPVSSSALGDALDTHPALEKRALAVQRALPPAMAVYKKKLRRAAGPGRV
jgi:Zn-dependent protease with chaperone function